MSIRQVVEGILGTHVTWDEFEKNLTKALNTCARFGSNKSAVDIGEGIMGSCMAIAALADLLPPEQNLLKDGPPEMWERLENNIKDMHNIECDTYDFMEQFDDGVTVPKRYYARAFNDENLLAGQICMEYMENAQMMNLHEKATIDQMKQIARALGKLQADSTKFDVVSETIKTKDVFAEFTKSMPKEQYTMAFGPLKQFEASLTESVEKVEEIMEDYYGATLPSTIHKQLGLTPVLVNGDLRTENILVDKYTGDLRALIDWQCTHLGVGVEDLLRISFFAQTTEDRRATADLLIEEMYNSFVANLGSAPIPYSLKQLKEVYDLLFPHCAIFFATGIIMLMRPHKPQTGDDEEKQRRYEIVVDKARGVLEDIATYHEKNKTSKQSVDWNYAAA